jgi:hypothetical protein
MNVIPFTAFIRAVALETVAPRTNTKASIERLNAACERTRRDLEGYGYGDNE